MRTIHSTAVDDFEDAEAFEFQNSQQRSIVGPDLIETEALKTEEFLGVTESALGTVDRFPFCVLFSDTYR